MGFKTRHFAQFLVFVVLFVAGATLSAKSLSKVYPTPERCGEIRALPLPQSPCQKQNSTFIVPNVPDELESVGSGILLLSFFAGTALTLIADVILWRWFRLQGQSFVEFVKYSVLTEAVQTTICLTSCVAFCVAFLNHETDWHDILQSSMDPGLNDEDWERVMQTLFCAAQSTVFNTFFVSEMFAVSGVTTDLLLHMLPSSAFNKVERQIEISEKHSINVHAWDMCSTLCEAWSVYLWGAAPAIRRYNLVMLAVAFRTLRFSRVFDKMIDSADLKSTVVVGQDALEDKDLQVLYWKQLSALGLTLLKAVFFLWSCSIVAMIIEGFACQYNVPYGTSPCDCSPQMRESVVALYFMFTTGTSVGFGDFVPITELGMMLVIGFMLAAVSVVPGWGNEVLDIVSCVNQTRHARARLRRHKKHNKRVGADLYAISENPVSTTLGFASPYLETSRDDQRRMGGKSSSMLKIPKLPTSVVSPNPSARLSSMRSDNWFDAEDDDAALQQLLKRLNEDHRTMMDLVRIAKHQAEQLVAKRA